MRHYSGGSLNGSLFSGGATLSGMGDWWDDLLTQTCPDGTVVGSLQDCPELPGVEPPPPGSVLNPTADDSPYGPVGANGTPCSHRDGAAYGVVGGKWLDGMCTIRKPGDQCTTPEIDIGQIGSDGYCYAVKGMTTQTSDPGCILSNGQKGFKRWMPGENRFECVDAATIGALAKKIPTGPLTYTPPKPGSTGGGGVKVTPAVTPVAPVQQAGIFGVSPFAIGLGLLVAVGGAMYYRRKKKAGGFKKNWHEDEDDFADASGWELPAMSIFSGALAGQTLAGTTLAGTTLGGITLEGTTLHDTAGGVDPAMVKEGPCQSAEYDPSCGWQKDVYDKSGTLGVSPQSFCDNVKYLFGPNADGCSKALETKNWPYTEFKPVANFCGPGYRVSKAGGCEIDPANPPVLKQDFCDNGYVNLPGQGCVRAPSPAAPVIGVESSRNMIIGAVVVLGVVAALVASQKKGKGRYELPPAGDWFRRERPRFV